MHKTVYLNDNKINFFKTKKTGYKGSEASVYVFSWQKQFYDKQARW